MLGLKIAATGAVMLAVVSFLFILLHAADCEVSSEIFTWAAVFSLVVVGAGLLIQVWL